MIAARVGPMPDLRQYREQAGEGLHHVRRREIETGYQYLLDGFGVQEEDLSDAERLALRMLATPGQSGSDYHLEAIAQLAYRIRHAGGES